MGQQQLMLILIVTIIVGIATVVGIQMFGEGADSFALDAVTLDLLEIGVEAQGYYIRPTSIDGGGRSFENLNFNDLSLSVEIDEDSDEIARNLNATYTISGQSRTEFLVTAELNDANNRFIAIRVCQNQNHLGNVGVGSAPEPPPCD